MRHGLRILSAADDEVDAIAFYIARDSVDSAARFYDSINATYKAILANPKRWPLYGFGNPLLKDLRKLAVTGFPNYLVFYRIDADMVEIVNVVHGARDFPTMFGESSLP
jgi:plasmid stabilization system protein ParE